MNDFFQNQCMSQAGFMEKQEDFQTGKHDRLKNKRITPITTFIPDIKSQVER